MEFQLVKQADLPFSNIANELEILIILEGEATFEISGDEVIAVAGDVAIVPAGTPHAFKNTGDGPLRQIDIHVSPTFSTTWL